MNDDYYVYEADGGVIVSLDGVAEIRIFEEFAIQYVNFMDMFIDEIDIPVEVYDEVSELLDEIREVTNAR